jgi:hypothetical protein
MPKRGVAYSFSRGLYDATRAGHFRVNPTIVAGDFTLSKENGAFVPLTTLPVVSPVGSALVLFQLTAAEMTATRLTILGVDQAGGQWTEFMEHFEPEPLTVADLPTAVQVADAVLTRDWTAVPTAPATFSLWNALRFLRNVWTLTPGILPAAPVLHVKTEDGVTDAWVRPVTTDAAALPVTGVQ